jgi:uncharacterized protein YndB with AHSA1/START domain
VTPILVLTSRWRLDAAPEAVWRLLTDLEGWPRWWRYVRRARILGRGAASPVGDVAEIVWTSALPYGIRLQVTTAAAERASLLEGHAEGDLRGVGTWLLEAAASGGVDVTYRWEVGLTRRWMRALAFLMRPVFEWNHFVVMRAGARGMAAALGCRLSALHEWSGGSRR